MEDAVVVLNPNEALRAARADAGGRFRFDRINPGRYTIRTTWIGYAPDERVIQVPQDGLQIEIVLTPSALEARMTFILRPRRWIRTG